MTKVVLSIRSLDIGGAERQFIELLKHIDKSRFDVTVCTMYGGLQEDQVRKIPKVKYINLEKKGRYDLMGFYRKYRNLLDGIKPDAIYSFLGEMNLFSLWCKPKDTKLIWGLRASNMDLKKYGKVPQIIFRLQKSCSPKVDRIVANSHAAIVFHRDKGFDMSRSTVIHNGIDTLRFQRNEQAREAFRERFDMNESDIAIGMVARIDAMKGYPVFVKAAKILLERYEHLKFFAIGSGDEKIKKECEAILETYNEQRFFWLGRWTDIEEIYSGLDLAVSSSFSEGFSNSIAEAMSCQVPCIVTDVGDSALIVAETGEVVAPGDVEGTVAAIERMMAADLEERGHRARERIVENFSIDRMVKQTQKVLIECVES